MEKIPFTITNYRKGDIVKTNQGTEIRILCLDSPDRIYPVIGVSNDAEGHLFTWTKDGKFINWESAENNNDLVIFREDPVLYTNVHRNSNGVHYTQSIGAFCSMAHCVNFGQKSSDYIGTFKLVRVTDNKGELISKELMDANYHEQ